MSGTLRIKNWNSFQHYKRRSPPWIKLHRALLDNREFQELEDGPARLLIQLWLIASEDDGCLPNDSGALAWRLRKPVEPIRASLQVLIAAGFITASGQDASIPLAPCVQHATPEAETEAEAERETKTERTTLVPSAKTPIAPAHVEKPEKANRKPVRPTSGPADDPLFVEAWSCYPKRAGTNSRADAEKQWRARIKGGTDPAAMLAGVQRYAAFCDATDSTGTTYVMQGARFFGPGRHFEEAYDAPVTAEEPDPAKAQWAKVEEDQAWLAERARKSAAARASA